MSDDVNEMEFDNGPDPLYFYFCNKAYDKRCYNCIVEWLDDECSLEPERCDTCIVDGIYTKFEIDQWRLDNNQLHTSDSGVAITVEEAVDLAMEGLLRPK